MIGISVGSGQELYPKTGVRRLLRVAVAEDGTDRYMSPVGRIMYRQQVQRASDPRQGAVPPPSNLGRK